MKHQVKRPSLDNKIPHRITEVLIPEGQNSNAIVMPLIASISGKQTDGWLTWITHRKPSKDQLTLLGAKTNKLRILHINANTDSRWMIWEALAKGNSHTVIADSYTLNAGDLNELEYAALKGNSLGICIKSAT